jgi:asparagine synthase (glutamine-hydrolysing)
MCGIAGIFRWDKKNISEESITRFTDSMAHRGPDGKGIWRNEDYSLAFGHRRLSILDLSDAAAQPFHSLNKRYSLTYNGEIFNFAELKSELMQNGFSFHTNSDTEVLLNSWIHWGKDCLYKFNGMWAFAIWDKEKEILTLCRDRFGIKPLYYCLTPGKQLAFASETYAFKFLDGFQREADPVNLNIALQQMFALEGRGLTPFKNVSSVPPGHFMTVSTTGNIQLARWWDTLENLPEIPSSYEECVLKLRELLEDACRIRLRSDVPIATALSGGVDSSAVYAMTYQAGQKQNKANLHQAIEWQHAYTASFPGSLTDETEYARKVSNHIGGKLIEVHQSFQSLADRLIQDMRIFDSIYLSPVTVASDLYKKMYSDGIRVSLDGHGVDEMTYGYGHSVKDAWMEEMRAGNTAYASDLGNTFVQLFPPELQNHIRESLLQTNFENPTAPTPESFNKNLYNRFVPDSVKEIYRSWRGSPKAPTPWIKPHSNKLNPFIIHTPEKEKSQYLEFHESTLPTLLRNFDRASMMAGIESRMPFMDYRIVCFLFALPREYKLGHGYTKRIIRDAIQPYLPADIVYRTWKVGFNAPLNDWFAGPLKPWIQDVVNSHSFRTNENWNGKAIADFVHKKYQAQTWGQEECMQLWPYLSAFELLQKV